MAKLSKVQSLQKTSRLSEDVNCVKVCKLCLISAVGPPSPNLVLPTSSPINLANFPAPAPLRPPSSAQEDQRAPVSVFRPDQPPPTGSTVIRLYSFHYRQYIAKPRHQKYLSSCPIKIFSDCHSPLAQISQIILCNSKTHTRSLVSGDITNDICTNILS